MKKYRRPGRCTGRVSLGMGMHTRCALSTRHRGPCVPPDEASK